MLRIKCQKPQNATIDKIRKAVEDWVAQREEVLTVERQTIILLNTEPDGSGTDYCRGQFRFDLNAESKAELLSSIENQLQRYCSWWRIKYHVCDHDEQERVGCSWDDVREYGPVPSELD